MINLRSTKGIMDELEGVLNSILEGSSPIDVADIRIRCCKHAIQVIALSYAASKNEKNFNRNSLKPLELEK